MTELSDVLTQNVTEIPTPSAILEKLLFERHSTRAFTDDFPDRATIERILWLAQRTATWCNVQPWDVRVAQGASLDRTRRVLAGAVERGIDTWAIEPPQPYEGVFQARRRETGIGLHNAIGIDRYDMEARERQIAKNYTFFGAPVVLFISASQAMGDYGWVDAGAYIANLALAAQSMSLGSIIQGAPAQYAEDVSAAIGVPADYRLIASVAVGIEDVANVANDFRTSRAPLHECVTFLE